jgi:broad specificity phosphatase PhoE
MYIYLVRHAHAGDRGPGLRDLYRPLTDQGHQRAHDLVELFAEIDVDHLVSSPATRCQQTLGPLSHARGLEIAESDAIKEGADIVEAIDFLASLPGKRIVACSHGDMIPPIIEQLQGLGMTVSGRGCERGSVWAIKRSRKRRVWTEARYIGPKKPSLT